MLDIQKIYEEWLRKGNDLHRKKRYQGKESWFHASSSGMCMRKHYFQHVANVEPKDIDDDTMSCLLYKSQSPREVEESRMKSSA